VNNDKDTQHKVEFVYFDLGNVLAAFDVDRACDNLAKRFGVEAKQVLATLWTSGAQHCYEHGHVDDEAFATLAREGLGLASDAASTDELLDLLSDMFEPIEPMADVVDAVRRNGVGVGILSNTCVAHWRWILEQDYPALRGNFDQIVLSYEHGVMKPTASIYKIAQRFAGCPPEAILFLDDRHENVEAAIQCGWQAFLFTDAPSAGELLRCTGVID